MKTSFLGMVELSNGKAETIVDALDKFLAETGYLQLTSQDLVLMCFSDGWKKVLGMY